MGQDYSKPSEKLDTPTVAKPREVAVNYEETPPRFSVHNTEELQQGIEYLEEHGYAVFSDVHSADQVKESTDLLWKFLENLEEPYNIRRDNPQSWNKYWPGIPDVGLLNQYDIGQSEFLWSVRGNPNVKKVFSRIWKSDELCVSFDGAGCFRNWYLNKDWKTDGSWYHCDQNPFKKPTRCSIQGLVALTDNDEKTGGLVVVPQSHKDFLELQLSNIKERLHGDYVSVPSYHPIIQKLPPRLIKCKAGDLVLWDSRCIHCNTPALVEEDNADEKEISKQPALLRLVAYVCMSPISMFKPDPFAFDTIEEFRRLREDFVHDGITCSHWPLQLVSGSRRKQKKKTPLKLNAYQHSLIIGTNVEPDKDNTEFVF